MKPYLDFSSYLAPDSHRAVFTTKHYPYCDSGDRIQLAKENNWPPEKLVIPIQKHTSHTAIVTTPGRYESTDGVFTLSDELVLSIQVADCIPLFFVDPLTGMSGLVHAGWRGIVAGIIPDALAKIVSLSVSPQNVRCVLGPSIQACCFEVGSEILHHFPEQYQLSDYKKPHIDLQSLVKDQLVQLGCREENVTVMKSCTKCDQTYHSYRRSGKKAGRMIAMLGFIAK